MCVCVYVWPSFQGRLFISSRYVRIEMYIQYLAFIIMVIFTSTMSIMLHVYIHMYMHIRKIPFIRVLKTVEVHVMLFLLSCVSRDLVRGRGRRVNWSAKQSTMTS